LDKWLGNDCPTLFNALEAKGLSWAVYYDEEDVFSATFLIHFPKLLPYVFTHFHTMDRFYRDVANGKLPSYAFVEPRLMLNHNDQHPPVQVAGWTQPSTVTAGEELMNSVYDAIRTSVSTGGSNYRNTLLAITYDEHGGCYDHVSPGPAAPPHNPAEVGQMGFTFDRLGVRVPMVMVSAWTSPFHVVSTPLDHCSMLRTLEMKWGLEPLTQRDASAPDFLEVFDRQTPRPNTEWPVLEPLAQPLAAAGTHNLNHPLNELQKAIVGTVNHLGEKARELDETMTVGQALEFMRSKKAELAAL
jgi:phospholipase C